MSSSETKQSAEQRFRAAFERLKDGKPELLPEGTPVSQNNVAKEAGCDPSALRNHGFHRLIAEIRQYVESHKGEAPESKRQRILKQRRKNRETSETIADLKQQRDVVVGMLADANLLIVELTEELADVRRRLDELKPSATTISISETEQLTGGAKCHYTVRDMVPRRMASLTTAYHEFRILTRTFCYIVKS